MWVHLGYGYGFTFISYEDCEELLQKCALDFKPRYYQRYFDDILVLFTLPDN